MTRSLRPAGAALVAVVALLGTVLAATPAHAAGPTLGITSPTAPPAVRGITTISVDASSDAGDPFTSVTLELDGSPLTVATDSCTGAEGSCTFTGTADFTTQNGSHTVTATVTTTLNGSASDTLIFFVSNPAPTASITNPGTITGPASLQVGGSTDNRLNDFPASIAVVIDDGTASARTLTPVTCSGSAHLCAGTTSWDASALSGVHTITATLTTTRGLTDVATRNVNVSSPAPTTAITSPSDGGTVSGTVVVDATASTDNRLTEVPTSVSLFVDGSLTPTDTQPCVPLANDCSLTLTWDATGLTGSHTLRTTVTTSAGRTADSSIVTVTVTTPPFDVAVTSPAAGTVVVGSGATALTSGIVPVGVSASTDQTQNEFPATLELLVDGVAVASTACPGPPVRQCSATLSWDARRVAGAHKLAARVTTNRSHEATSASRTVYTRSGTRVAFYAIPSAAFGGVATVRGRVISTTSGQPLVGVWVRLTMAPAVGKGRVALVKTGIGGVFSYRTRVYSNTRTTALVGNSWLVRSAAVTLLRVRAPIVCTTTASAYFSGSVGRGVCTVRNLPPGTVVRLRYAYKGRWFTLATGRTTSSVIPFSFRFVPRGTYYLQVVLGGNRVYIASLGKLMKVAIR